MSDNDYYLGKDSLKIIKEEGLGDIDLGNLYSLAAIRDELIKEKRYRRAKAVNHILAIEEVKAGVSDYLHYPVIMHIELTSACNCECIMCTHAYERNDNAMFFDFDSIVEYLPACKLIVLNGVGEPFIHPYITEILKQLRYYEVKASITTNLSYLSDELLTLIPTVFKRISISCDGAAEYTFKKIRRKGSFYTFLENAKKIRSVCDETIIHMAVTIMRQNILEAPALVELAASLGFDEIRFGRLETNPFLENEKDSLIWYPNATSMILQTCRKLAEEHAIKISIPVIFDRQYDGELAEKELIEIRKKEFFKDEKYYDDIYDAHKELYKIGCFASKLYEPTPKVHSHGMCHWLALGININILGQIRPCGEIVREVPEKNAMHPSSGYNMMNIPEIKKLRQIFEDGYVPDVCMNCSYLMNQEFGWLHVDRDEYSKSLFQMIDSMEK